MNARFYISTAPAADPITAAEIEAALRLSSGFDSTTVSRLVTASVRQVEIDTDRSLITRTITGKLDQWPKGGVIHLPKPPFVAVTSLKYFDTAGTEQTLVENTDYEVKLSGDSGRVVVVPGGSWPSVQSDRVGSIEIVYTAGYGLLVSNVPGDLREACIKMGVMMYTNGAIDDTMYKILIDGRKHYFDYHIND
jgi:uncharacterized phiE125 gp8 family phage protein